MLHFTQSATLQSECDNYANYNSLIQHTFLTSTRLALKHRKKYMNKKNHTFNIVLDEIGNSRVSEEISSSHLKVERSQYELKNVSNDPLLMSSFKVMMINDSFETGFISNQDF